MLDKLFNSAARLKVLKFFLLNPEKWRYPREAARNSGLGERTAQREIEGLKKLGVLIVAGSLDKGAGFIARGKAEKQKRKSFCANRNFFLFEELKALVTKAQILCEKNFVRRLKKIGNPKLLVFTGIFVNNFNSPIDILIVGRLNKAALPQLIRGLEKEVGREINFTLMSQSELKYRREVTDVFLYNILEGKKIVAIDKIGLV